MLVKIVDSVSISPGYQEEMQQADIHCPSAVERHAQNFKAEDDSDV